MQVILKKDIKDLGKAGEVKEVKEGYATNYLFPRGLAEEVTAGKLKEIKQKNANRKDKEEREKEQAQKAATKIEKLQINLKARCGEKGKLFGAITNADVAKALKAKGFNINKRKIEIGQPIKSLGSHQITIKLHGEVSTDLKILVEEEKGE